MKAPPQPMQLITPSWPLQQWGIEIIDKLTHVQGNYTFIIVAVEYFTKWLRETPHECKFCISQKILLTKHHLPLRCPSTHHSRQRQVLQQCNVQGFLLADWNEGRIRFSVSPPD
jgi:hypothetical protein